MFATKLLQSHAIHRKYLLVFLIVFGFLLCLYNIDGIFNHTNHILIIQHAELKNVQLSAHKIAKEISTDENGKILSIPIKSHSTASELTSAEIEIKIESELKDLSLLVNTSGCKITKLDPFGPTFDQQLYKNFTGRELRCFSESSKSKPVTITRINFSSIRIIKPPNVHCYSKQILKHPKDDLKYFVSNKTRKFIRKKITRFPNYSAVLIECFKDLYPIHKEAVPLIPNLKPNVVLDTDVLDKPNILILLIDSTSRLNFERQFTYTKKFLIENDFVTLFGHAKVADNTFVNLMPILTGRYAQEFRSLVKQNGMYFDKVPLIWREFEEKGYITYYAEDMQAYSSFHYYGRKGFRKQPTTYWTHPFVLAYEESMESQHCYNGKPEIQIHYDLLLDFVRYTNINNKKFFAICFMSRLPHDELNKAGLVDLPLHNLLKTLFDEKLVNNTAIFVMSDHGIRFGAIRKTLTGKMEERLPQMALRLPDGQTNSNLMLNQHRFTTHFDTHATLLHLLKGKSPKALPYGRSLLEEIPENKTCSSVKLPVHYCPCFVPVQVNNNSTLSLLLNKIVNYLNNFINGTKCQPFIPLEVQTSYEETESELENSGTKSYLTTIRTMVASGQVALFEATIVITREKKISLKGDISRLDRYANLNTSCEKSMLQKYCICP